MALFPGALLPNVKPQFFDEDGNPVAGGFLYFYEAGTSTPIDTFSDVDLTPGQENSNPIELDASGYSATSIFLQPTGYKVVLTDADAVELWSVDDVEDIGQTFASNFGTILAEGSTEVTSGYDVLTTDRLVTVDSTGGASPCLINLPPAADYTQMLTIKNLGNVPLAVLPNGADTIDTMTAATILAAGAFPPASVPPIYTSIVLISVGVSSWWCIASHGIGL